MRNDEYHEKRFTGGEDLREFFHAMTGLRKVMAKNWPLRSS